MGPHRTDTFEWSEVKLSPALAPSKGLSATLFGNSLLAFGVSHVGSTSDDEAAGGENDRDEVTAQCVVLGLSPPDKGAAIVQSQSQVAWRLRQWRDAGRRYPAPPVRAAITASLLEAARLFSMVARVRGRCCGMCGRSRVRAGVRGAGSVMRADCGDQAKAAKVHAAWQEDRMERALARKREERRRSKQ